MLQSPPPPQAVTPDPRRSTRTRKPSTRLVLAVTTASPPHRLHRINGEPLESWPPKPEDLPAALHHLLPKRGRGAKTTGAKKAGKQAAKKALTASRHPGSGTSPSNNSDLKPSSLEPPVVALWSHRTMGASNVYYHAESAVRDSLAREDEIRAAWVRNEPVRLEQERRWDMEDRVVKRKLGFMVEHFIAREREEEEGKGERTDSGHEEEVEEEEEETEREVKKAKRE